MQKILDLKSGASSPYFRRLAKQIANASFGFTMLKKECYGETRLAIGPQQMIKAVTHPRLKSFKLLNSDTLIATISKRSIKYDSLLFVGATILSASKEYFLRTYYKTMKPQLTRCLGIFAEDLEVTCCYVDTDCVALEITAPSFASSNKLLRQSDLLYCIKECVDFGPFLDHPQSRVLKEIREQTTPGEFTKFLIRVK